MNYTTSCRSGNRCRSWRTCDSCAAIRQAQIADVAEEGAATSPKITYAVARTYAQATISKDKAKFLTRLRSATEGGIWTIEKGEISGLHINIIAGTSSELTAGMLAEMWPSDADFWASEIPRKDVRNVAAYSSKKGQFPDKQDYGGNLYGSFGSWKRPLHILAESGTVIQKALALEKIIEDLGVPEPEETPGDFIWPSPVRAPYSKKESYKDRKNRAKKNTDDFIEKQEKARLEKQGVNARNNLKRLYAAHRGEIELEGYAYLPGHGIVTIDDLKKIGFTDLPVSEKNDR